MQADNLQSSRNREELERCMITQQSVDCFRVIQQLVPKWEWHSPGLLVALCRHLQMCSSFCSAMHQSKEIPNDDYVLKLHFKEPPQNQSIHVSEPLKSVKCSCNSTSNSDGRLCQKLALLHLFAYLFLVLTKHRTGNKSELPALLISPACFSKKMWFDSQRLGRLGSELISDSSSWCQSGMFVQSLDRRPIFLSGILKTIVCIKINKKKAAWFFSMHKMV